MRHFWKELEEMKKETSDVIAARKLVMAKAAYEAFIKRDGTLVDRNNMDKKEEILKILEERIKKVTDCEKCFLFETCEKVKGDLRTDTTLQFRVDVDRCLSIFCPLESLISKELSNKRTEIIESLCKK